MSDPRMIPCEHCDGSGRESRESGEFSRFNGAMIIHDCGPCQVCNGTLVEEIEVEPITEDDLAQCDCCGEDGHLTRCWAYGIETFACGKCRGDTP